MDKLKQNSVQNFLKTKFDPSMISKIRIIEKRIKEAISDTGDLIGKACNHILNSGGKRIRPLLVMYSGRIFSPVSERLLNIAAAAELIHMASLVHDDILDKSSMRRSKPSINAIWGNHSAVLCGDFLFARAFGLLASDESRKIMEFMVRAIENMCNGEILQTGHRFNIDMSIDTYLDIITKKSAILLECCCISGAEASKADTYYVEALGRYGLCLGIAFQMIDDIMDICGDNRKTGKPVFEDMMNGTITLPVILMMGNKNLRKPVKEVLGNGKPERIKVERIGYMAKKSGVISKCFKIASQYIDEAQNSLSELPQNEYTVKLDNLANMLRERAN